MDRQLKAEIVATVRRSVAEAMEVYYERWLTAKEIGEHISILSERWLRDNGDMLPRTRMEWTDQEGRQHTSSWIYPLHRLQAMIDDGRIKSLRKAT
jgi:hypothetical protein